MPTSKIWVILGTLVIGAALTCMLAFGGGKPQPSQDPAQPEKAGEKPAEHSSIVVYCAVGLRPPVEEAAKRFQEETGTEVILDYDNSGGLLGKMKLEKGTNPRGDLYIPADDSFIDLSREADLTREVLPLAKFRLTLAVKPGNPKKIQSLDDLKRNDVVFVYCDEKAAAGKVAQKRLEKAGKLTELKSRVKSEKATVTEAAMVVKVSNDIDAAFVWDSTARQYGLEMVDVPELAGASSTVSAAVIGTSPHPANALRFARYLSAPEKGGAIFKKLYYEPLEGDPWAEKPSITLFAGGTNRMAIKVSLEAFEAREGCTINTVFAGCGTLNGMIETGQGNKPDLYLTCDAAFLKKVADRFDTPTDVSTTRLTLLVRKEKADKIHSIEDLGQEGLSLGVGDEELGALGAITKKVLKERGIYDAVRRNVVVTSPTAHELVLQVEAHNKLDAAIVYEVNCNRIDKDKLVAVPVNLPSAIALQNVALAKDTKYKLLSGRLLQTLLSIDSRSRFEKEGFKWKADPARKP